MQIRSMQSTEVAIVTSGRHSLLTRRASIFYCPSSLVTISLKLMDANYNIARSQKHAPKLLIFQPDRLWSDKRGMINKVK